MPEYKDYELVGGQPVKISPFDAAAAGEGVHFAKEGCAFNPVIVSGGGNPNHVETITGTLENPWGDLSYTSLVHAIQSKEVTTLLSVVLPDDSAWIFPLIPRMWDNPTDLALIASAAYPAGFLPQVTMMGGCVVYEQYSGETSPHCAAIVVSSPDTNYQWVNLIEQMSQLPATLTIIHHPLPDTP